MRDFHRTDPFKNSKKNLKVEDSYPLNSFRQSIQHHESNKTLESLHKIQKSFSHLNSSPKFTHQNFQQHSSLNRQILDRVMKLQGECKIQSWEFLQFNKFKAALSIFLLTISVFGLFALKYSYWIRKVTMFDVVTTENSATHIFIRGNDHKNQISKILEPSSVPIFFHYKRLKYFIQKIGKPIPVSYLFQNDFENCFNSLRYEIGLNEPEVKLKRQLYGSNQHLAQFPTYPEYLIDVLTQPFFLLQYFFCFIFFMQGYAPFSIALLFFSFVTSTVNYIMLYVSYRKIKQIAEKVIEVKVMRNGKQIKINSKELVPGDVYIPEEGQQVPADCIVGLGDIYVNEANLTGQSIPIGKFRLQDYSSTKKTNTWIFQGSKVLERKVGKNYAVVINTGFETLRGQIIRKILNRSVKDPDILRSTLIFVIEVLIVGLLVYFSTIRILLESDIDRLFVFFKFIDFLASSAPPPLPILFNLAYSFSLLRLRMKGIEGTQPQKVVEGARLKTFCFDKTGTLTQSDVKIKKILKLEESDMMSFKEVIDQIQEEKNQTLWQLFATCHTTKLIQGELLGDQIDKQMFLFAQAEMQTSNDPNIRLVVKSKDHQTLKKKKQKLEVLRINQFESKFQSMSVLVRDVISDKLYVYVKGSSEILLQNCPSIRKAQKKTMVYQKKVKGLSINGYRTIAVGFKTIPKDQLNSYLKAERQQYVKNIKILGLISFQNSLKHDSREMIQELIRSNIQPKMITGDNIYIAVESAKRAGILSSEDQIVFLEGKNNADYSQIYSQNFPQPSTEHINRKFKGTIMKQTFDLNGEISQFSQHQISIDQKSSYVQGNYIFAVDNQFLMMDPAKYLSDKIRIFSRIPPQNKALIIKKYKQQHRQFIQKHYSKFIRFLKIKNQKIGMCGDGANDLIALRQADLSIGIHTTDASYGSSFTVKNMLDVNQVVKQAKGTLANIINLYQYYASIAFCFVICSMILARQATFTSTAQLMLINFCAILMTPVLITLSRPSSTQSEYVPENNMMSLHNHLVFWGNSILPFLGVLASWLYLSHTDQFKVNPFPKATIASGFNSKNHTTTLVYILQLMITSVNGFIMYQGQPWRLPIYKNFFLLILLIINFCLSIIFAFFADHILLFQFQPISHKNMAICLGILLGMLGINFVYNEAIKCFRLNYKLIGPQRRND